MSFALQLVVLGSSALIGAAQPTDTAAAEQQAILTRRIERLEKQNAVLKASYTQARVEAEQAAAQLVDIRTRLEALGGAALGNSEERLIQAMADIEAMNTRIQRLEQASVNLTGAILAYMKQAISEDAQARSAVEVSLRRLEAALGYRQQPVRDGAGSLSAANVLSIDSESGLLVLNVGRTAGAQVGMPLQITRGALTIGQAVVTDVRKEVCGALVQRLETPADPVRVGDSASVKTND